MSKPKPPLADKAAADNRSNQLNPNHDAYWASRGMSKRPPARGTGGRGR